MSLNTEPALYTKLGFDPAYLPTFEDKIFIEGPQTALRLTNFFTLLLLATVIAPYGVLSNSTLIAIPLSLTAYENVTSIQENNTATATVENWLQGTSYQVDSVSVNDRVVSVTIDGTGQTKPLQQLSNQLARVLRRPILVYLRTVPSQNSESSSP